MNVLTTWRWHVSLKYCHMKHPSCDCCWSLFLCANVFTAINFTSVYTFTLTMVSYQCHQLYKNEPPKNDLPHFAVLLYESTELGLFVILSCWRHANRTSSLSTWRCGQLELFPQQAMFVDPSADCPSNHSSCSLVAGRFAFSICLPTHLPFVFCSTAPPPSSSASSSSPSRALHAAHNLFIDSQATRSTWRRAGGRAAMPTRRANVDGLDSLRSDSAPARQLVRAKIRPSTGPAGIQTDGRTTERGRAKLPVMITDETIYLGDHPTLVVVCHRRWKCDSAIMWSCVVQAAGRPM